MSKIKEENKVSVKALEDFPPSIGLTKDGK
jgi:hypothetical protein